MFQLHVPCHCNSARPAVHGVQTVELSHSSMFGGLQEKGHRNQGTVFVCLGLLKSLTCAIPHLALRSAEETSLLMQHYQRHLRM